METASRILSTLFVFLWASICLAGPDLPDAWQQEIRYEQVHNDRVMDIVFRRLNIEEKVDPRYDPKFNKSFPISYLEVPIKDIEFWGSVESKAYKQLAFVRDGITYVKFYIHPESIELYQDYIRKYGGLKYGGDHAAPKASIRTLFLWNEKRSDSPLHLKTSLDLNIGGLSRLVKRDELIRGYITSRLIEGISEETKDEYGFDFVEEPFAMLIKGTGFGNLVKERPNHLTKDGKSVIPGFSLTSKGPNGEKPILIEMIKKSGMDPYDYISERILRPFLRSYVYLTFVEGLVGQPHQQNVSVQVDKNGQPTGKFIYRDLDAFRIDTELRVLHGKNIHPIVELENPFGDLRLYGYDYFQKSYGIYVRNDWAFHFDLFLRKYADELELSKERANSHDIWGVLDRIFLEELETMFDVQAIVSSSKKNALMLMVESYKKHSFDLEKMADKIKARLRKFEIGSKEQARLQKRFAALGKKGRAVREKLDTRGLRYYEAGSLIVGVSSGGTTSRLAIEMPAKSSQSCISKLMELAKGFLRKL